MPRTEITVQTVGKNSNAELTFAAMDQSNGMMFINDGKTVLVVKNDDASPHELTVVSTGDPVYGRTGDIVKSVLAGDLEIVGALPQAGWNQTSTNVGKVHVDVDGDTSMLVAAASIT